jgi:hypothetical protein
MTRKSFGNTYTAGRVAHYTSHGVKLADPVDIADAFNNQFRDNYSQAIPSSSKWISGDAPTITPINSFSFTDTSVQYVLHNIRPNAAPGPDLVPGRILHQCATSLAPSLCSIFNLSASTDAWKKASVVPVFKKRDR